MALLAGLQAGIGLAQFGAGLFRKKPKRPKYNIPQEVFENMSDAEYYAFAGLPEEQKSQALNQMREQSTRALFEANTRKAGLGTITKLAEAEQEGVVNLAVQDSMARMRNLDRLQSARTEVQKARDKEFGVKMQRFEDKRARRDALIGGGLQNIVKAAGSLEGQGKSLLSGLFGGGAIPS